MLTVLAAVGIVVGGVAGAVSLDLAHRRRARRYQLRLVGRNNAES